MTRPATRATGTIQTTQATQTTQTTQATHPTVEMMTKSTAIVLAAAALCAGTDARRLTDASDDASCVTVSTPKDFIRLWGIELGGDAATDVDALGGLPCDDSWETYDADSAPYLKKDVWASAPATLKEVMASLKLSSGDPDAEVFRCGKEGVRWYTVNDFKGCALRDGETFDYRGKAYKNTGKTHVDSLAATLSYVCNGQARRRDIGVTYTAVVETKCK